VADTVLTNTLLPAGPGGNTLELESLRQAVEMVARDEAPLYRSIPDTTAMAIKEEWGIEDIGTVVASPARNDGFVAAIQAPFTPQRFDNYVQLTAVEFGVSDTMANIRAAGNTNTLNHQRLKWGLFHERCNNKLLWTPQVKSGVAPRTMGTLPTYITNFGSNAVTPGAAPAGNGTTLPGAGTTPALLTSIDPIRNRMAAAILKAGVPDVIAMSPRNKMDFSDLPDAHIGELHVTKDAGDRTPFEFIGAADVYVSDFGVLEVVVDIDAPNTAIMGLNFDLVDKPVVPGMNMDEKMLGIRGSGEEMLIQTAWTVRVLNPTAHFYINGFTA
jgi:hypothetical protein